MWFLSIYKVTKCEKNYEKLEKTGSRFQIFGLSFIILLILYSKRQGLQRKSLFNLFL